LGSKLKIKHTAIHYINKIFFKKKKVHIEKKEEKPKLLKETLYFSFESFKEVPIKACYEKHPIFIIIENNKTEILKNLLDLLQKKFRINPKIGIELEFYLYDDVKNRFSKSAEYKKKIQKILDSVYKQAKAENIEILKLEKERGAGQFEVKTKPYTDIVKLSKHIKKLKSLIKKEAKKNGFFANFSAQPFVDDCGSSMQVNISLENKQGQNLFERILEEGEKRESDKLLHCVSGLCELMNVSMPFFVCSENCYKRYNLDLNKFLHQCGKYPAPTFISWGINNRTTALRIPNTVFKNIQQYKKEGDKNRRIEHRVPSSDADISMALIGVLMGICYGLNNKKEGNFKTYFNVFEKHEGFEQICKKYLSSSDFENFLRLLF